MRLVEPRLLTNTARLGWSLSGTATGCRADDRTRQETRRPKLRVPADGVKTANALLSGPGIRSMDTGYSRFPTGY